jgi:thiamine pyrophosphate-dependent acetolactate synthase large subunit-like protein
MMRRLLLFTFAIGIGYLVNAQQAMPDPHYKLIRGNSMVQMKNYYLLTLLQNDNEVKKLLESDTALVSIAKNKLNGLLQSKTACSLLQPQGKV